MGAEKEKTMQIEQGYSAVAVQIADNKRKSLSVEFVRKDLAEYRAALKAMAKERGYTAGEKVYGEDISIIKGHYEKLLGGMKERFAKQSEAFQSNVDVAQYLMAAHEYLFALTADALGSPEFTYYIYDDAIGDLFSNVAKDMNAARLGKEFSVSECFKAQRGLNADEMRDGRIGKLLTAVEEKDPSPDAVGALMAERQALMQRQQNHGAIWRFFHRKEEAARGALLAEMERALQTRISKEDMDVDPAQVINHMVTYALSRKMLGYESRPAEMFGYDVYKENPQLLEKFNANREARQRPAELQSFLRVGYRPNLHHLAQEWDMVKPLYDAVQSKQIWAENTPKNLAIKEILSKNYIRLQLFKMKFEKENGNVDKTDDLLFEMEPIYANEDSEFIRANPDYVVPKIPETFEKEKVSVDLGEARSETSARIEAPAKEAPKKDLGVN